MRAELGVVEGRDEFCAGDGAQALHAVKVRVLDGKDARVREKLLGVVVDQLPVDEHVDAEPVRPKHKCTFTLL